MHFPRWPSSTCPKSGRSNLCLNRYSFECESRCEDRLVPEVPQERLCEPIHRVLVGFNIYTQSILAHCAGSDRANGGKLHVGQFRGNVGTKHDREKVLYSRGAGEGNCIWEGLLIEDTLHTSLRIFRKHGLI